MKNARPSALRPAWLVVTAAVALVSGPPARAAGDVRSRPVGRVGREKVTSPATFFGHEIGADYVLPNYQQLTEYWRKLDRESDRMRLVEMGKTAEGRTQYMAVLSAPANLRKLDKYRAIARRLALAENLTDEQARELADEGKAVVWIDGGLHASEVLGAQQLMETVHQLVSRNDAETRRILDEVIVLAVHANPDGMDLVSDWYMRNPDPKKRSSVALPRLYQKYIGHDNNRDFYAATQPETRNMNRVMYREWFPQIVYNHHQTGPAGAVMFAPPFRDPFNYYYDPLIVTQLDLVGAAMHSRFAAEGKPGVTMRSGASYSTWWNGGLRTTAYFHNMIGLLTETIGHPNPMQIPFVIGRQLPRADLPNPIAPQTWHFRQSVDYSVTANYAVLDLAARQRETFLYRIYRMGRNAIERGSGDCWTVTPRRLEQVRKATAGRSGSGAAEDAESLRLLRAPDARDPRGYILPSSQPDFPTATKFVNALIENGITVHRARNEFTAGGGTYPAGSYVVKTAQAFRPHILDMFEPQDHPNDFQYPGGPPVAPYDSAGWTLAFQMGLQFDRILDGFSGPFEKIEGLARTPAGRVVNGEGTAAGYLLQHDANDAFIAVNRLLKSNAEVYWLTSGSAAVPAGAFFIPAGRGSAETVEKLARDLGLNFQAIANRPEGAAIRMRSRRVALWDRYGGSMPSGWARWVLEQFEFPFEVAYPRALDAGDLRSKYDVIIFMDGGIPDADPREPDTPSRAGIPAEYHNRLGSVTAAKTVPQLRKFMEDGGTVLSVGGSTSLAYHLGLPITDALTEPTTGGRTRKLPKEKFYIPGSVLQTRVDATLPIAHGLPERVDVFFDESPAFRLGPDAAAMGVRRVAWYDSKTPLRSGWAWGQEHLADAAAVVEAQVGKGRLYLFGPEITFRAQPHGTFKFLFNGIYAGPAEMVNLR